MSDGQLTRPGVLHLATKRLLLRTLYARLLQDYPNESAKARELLTDMEHDLLRLHAAEAEIVQLKLRLGGIKGAAIAHGVRA